MPGVIDKTEELIDVIKQSKEYKSYNEIRSFIAHESEIKDRIDHFRHDLFVLQNTAGDHREDFEKLHQEYRDILDDTQVMEYFSAEAALIHMFRDIYDRLGSAVELDLSFLGEVKELNL